MFFHPREGTASADSSRGQKDLPTVMGSLKTRLSGAGSQGAIKFRLKRKLLGEQNKKAEKAPSTGNWSRGRAGAGPVAPFLGKWRKRCKTQHLGQQLPKGKSGRQGSQQHRMRDRGSAQKERELWKAPETTPALLQGERAGTGDETPVLRERGGGETCPLEQQLEQRFAPRQDTCCPSARQFQ